MRSPTRLDRELEELAGTERNPVDLNKASEASDLRTRETDTMKFLEGILSDRPRVLAEFIRRGREWYEKHPQKRALSGRTFR